MTITHEPVHILIHKRLGTQQPPHPAVRYRPQPRVHAPQPQPQLPREAQPRVDVYRPRHEVRVDTLFWQHRSIFAGSQEQLDELKREAQERAAERGRALLGEYLASLRASTERSVLEAHRPAVRRLKAVVHAGLVPLLWNITTCRCGDRWPCNAIKQYFRRRLGWTIDITEHLKALTQRLPKPATRWARLRGLVTRRRRVRPDRCCAAGAGGGQPRTG